MRTLTLVTAAACVLAGAAPALATPAIAVDPAAAPAPDDDDDDDEDSRIVLEATAVMSLASLGSYSSTGWGPQLSLGHRSGELTVLAYAGLLETQATAMAFGPEHVGRTVRVGGGARFSFLTLTPDDDLELDLAFEVDAERRMLRWSSGGAVDRTAVMGGFILDMAFGSRERARRAFHYGFRLGGADGPGGSGIDFVALFELGMHWSG